MGEKPMGRTVESDDDLAAMASGDDDDEAGIAIKEQGVGYAAGAAMKSTGDLTTKAAAPRMAAGQTLPATGAGSDEWDREGDDPMAPEGTIVTTRSNIRSGGGVGHATGGGGGRDAPPDTAGAEPALDDPMAGAAGVNTTRSNIKSSSARTGEPGGGGGPVGGDEGPGVETDPMARAGSISTTRSNIRGAGHATGDGGGSDAPSDVGGADPDDDDPMAGASGINTTRSNIKSSGAVVGQREGGSASGAPDEAPGVTGEPIPGIDVRLD